MYEDVRRAIGYLRAREGDADTIAPSLFPGKAKFPKKEEEKKDQTQVPAGSVPVAPPAGTTPAGTAVVPAAPGTTPAQEPVTAGAQGPFMA